MRSSRSHWLVFRVDGRQPFRYAPERPPTGKVRFLRDSGVIEVIIEPSPAVVVGFDQAGARLWRFRSRSVFWVFQYFIHPAHRTMHDRIAETIVVSERVSRS